MQQQLLPYQFENHVLRVEVDADGEPLFHAGDLCAMLDYSNPWDAVRRHVEECDLVKREVTSHEATGTQRKTQLENYVREPGLWSLILGSHAPNARPVKRWVTAEVLPSIRKTGQYRAKGKGAAKPKGATIGQQLAAHPLRLKLLDALEQERNPEKRDAIHEQLAHASDLLGLSTPDKDRIGPPPEPAAPAEPRPMPVLTASPALAWIKDRLEPAPGQWTGISELYADYLRHCAAHRREPLSLRRFRHEVAAALARLGIDTLSLRRETGQGLKGVRLKPGGEPTRH